ncbi:MAG: DUF2807 domain-containing protein [Spirochaetaceae bacterium]|jgi:hypothetical protein|nr:DUF2807 domain-containing protein [Spirochaetaceae bacterium]
MKKNILIFLPMIFLVNSCFFYTGISGSGHYISTNYYVTGFYAVKAGDATIDSIKQGDFYSVSLTSDNLNLMIDDASNVNVYLTDATDITAAVSGASSLQISSIYPVENLNISCSEASTADLKDMICSYGEITVSGISSLRVNMIGSIIGQVSEASVLYFKGTVSPGPILLSGASGIVYY